MLPDLLEGISYAGELVENPTIDDILGKSCGGSRYYHNATVRTLLTDRVRDPNANLRRVIIARPPTSYSPTAYAFIGEKVSSQFFSNIFKKDFLKAASGLFLATHEFRLFSPFPRGNAPDPTNIAKQSVGILLDALQKDGYITMHDSVRYTGESAR